MLSSVLARIPCDSNTKSGSINDTAPICCILMSKLESSSTCPSGDARYNFCDLARSAKQIFAVMTITHVLTDCRQLYSSCSGVNSSAALSSAASTFAIVEHSTPLTRTTNEMASGVRNRSIPKKSAIAVVVTGSLDFMVSTNDADECEKLVAEAKKSRLLKRPAKINSLDSVLGTGCKFPVAMR